MDIKTAKYFKSPETGENSSIQIILNNSTERISVPLNSENSDYIEIMKRVNAGTLTIADAD